MTITLLTIPPYRFTYPKEVGYFQRPASRKRSSKGPGFISRMPRTGSWARQTGICGVYTNFQNHLQNYKKEIVSTSTSENEVYKATSVKLGMTQCGILSLLFVVVNALQSKTKQNSNKTVAENSCLFFL